MLENATAQWGSVAQFTRLQPIDNARSMNELHTLSAVADALMDGDTAAALGLVGRRILGLRLAAEYNSNTWADLMSPSSALSKLVSGKNRHRLLQRHAQMLKANGAAAGGRCSAAPSKVGPMASPKATVFPEPVCAETSRSRPVSASSTASCTAVGVE